MTVTGELPELTRRRRGWRTIAAYAVVGLVAGGALAFATSALTGPDMMPDSCDELIHSTAIEGALRTAGPVTPAVSRTDDAITCRWQSSGVEEDETKRSATLSVTVKRHGLTGAAEAVERVRDGGVEGDRSVPAGVGDEALVESGGGDKGTWRAEAGVRQGKVSIAVSYVVDSGDAAMAAHVAELVARNCLIDGASL